MATVFSCRHAVLLGFMLAITAGATAKDKGTEFLCIPERFWTCDGVGRCETDDRPETLAAWKLDVTNSRYALCRRDGRECGTWIQLSAKKDTAFLVLVDADWHPETFKIDRESGKFVAVRLSGGFVEIDTSTNPATVTPDLAQLRIRQRTGTCIQTKP
jgi:hypothetical protein